MKTNIPDDKTSPWHPGEIAMQRTVGAAERMETFAHKVIRTFMLDQHRNFYAQLPFLVLGTVDPGGNAWATLVTGQPGFASSPDPVLLRIATPRDTHDPANSGLEDGDAIGVLGIEPHTRRRNRMNGNIKRDDNATFTIEVEHAFGNCPQYILKRDWRFAEDTDAHPASSTQRLDHLDQSACTMIAGADTFFVASYVDLDDGHRQVDVSHRGGEPGFIDIATDGTLTIPDFPGNLHFNTLGNILINPKAGLIFIDFKNGNLLQLSGEAEVILDAPEISAHPGADRLWRFYPRIVVRRKKAIPLRWLS